MHKTLGQRVGALEVCGHRFKVEDIHPASVFLMLLWYRCGVKGSLGLFKVIKTAKEVNGGGGLNKECPP